MDYDDEPRGFGIDDGELADFSRQLCFVLGYELAQIEAGFHIGFVPAKPVHPQNRDRIQRLADSMDIKIEMVVYHDDWLWLKPKDE